MNWEYLYCVPSALCALLYLVFSTLDTEQGEKNGWFSASMFAAAFTVAVAANIFITGKCHL